jgi:CD68 antigen
MKFSPTMKTGFVYGLLFIVYCLLFHPGANQIQTKHKPQTPNLKPQTSNLKPQTSNFKPQTSNLKPQTINLKPQTSNLKLQTSNQP